MPKDKSIYLCNECGYESAKWLGKCPSCGEWNCMSEYTPPSEPLKKSSFGKTSAKHEERTIFSPYDDPVSLKDVSITDEIRYVSGMSETDRVLGGGLVKGSLVLLAGDPGVGKSTLMLQICHQLAKKCKILYISGEESSSQLKLRANRLNTDCENLYIYSNTNMSDILEKTMSLKPEILIIDSIQTVYKDSISSYPGSVTQVRECTLDLMVMAKSSGISVMLVGHVNKEGALAGPKVLEHMVDTVLYFEGDRNVSYRILRAVKNRFGSTNETGLFEMTGGGLIQIENPSAALLSGRPVGVSGMCALCAMEGSRPILTEVQALITPTVYNMPKRTVSGIDYNKLALLTAILEKRMNYKLSMNDVYVNVIGGLRVDDTACDLSVLLALASSYKDVAVDSASIVIGEVGLAGEVRSVGGIDVRLAESAKLGFKTALIPKNSKLISPPDNIDIYRVKNIGEAITLLSS